VEVREADIYGAGTPHPHGWTAGNNSNPKFQLEANHTILAYIKNTEMNLHRHIHILRERKI